MRDMESLPSMLCAARWPSRFLSEVKEPKQLQLITTCNTPLQIPGYRVGRLWSLILRYISSYAFQSTNAKFIRPKAKPPKKQRKMLAQLNQAQLPQTKKKRVIIHQNNQAVIHPKQQKFKRRMQHPLNSN